MTIQEAIDALEHAKKLGYPSDTVIQVDLLAKEIQDTYWEWDFDLGGVSQPLQIAINVFDEEGDEKISEITRDVKEYIEGEG